MHIIQKFLSLFYPISQINFFLFYRFIPWHLLGIFTTGLKIKNYSGCTRYKKCASFKFFFSIIGTFLSYSKVRSNCVFYSSHIYSFSGVMLPLVTIFWNCTVNLQECKKNYFIFHSLIVPFTIIIISSINKIQWMLKNFLIMIFIENGVTVFDSRKHCEQFGSALRGQEEGSLLLSIVKERVRRNKAGWFL